MIEYRKIQPADCLPIHSGISRDGFRKDHNESDKIQLSDQLCLIYGFRNLHTEVFTYCY